MIPVTYARFAIKKLCLNGLKTFRIFFSYFRRHSALDQQKQTSKQAKASREQAYYSCKSRCNTLADKTKSKVKSSMSHFTQYVIFSSLQLLFEFLVSIFGSVFCFLELTAILRPSQNFKNKPH